MKIKRRKFRLITEADKAGWLFILPFVIGVIFLYGKPMLQSLTYAFNRITVDDSGLVFDPIGWENFLYIKNEDATFTKNLYTVLTTSLYQIPVMMFVSMFIAIMVNEEFPGRLAFRVILFLPVIFASDQVLRWMSHFGISSEMTQTENSFTSISTEATGFVKEVISSFGPLSTFIEKFTAYSSKMFSLLWSTGIQIILFIIGLKTIPAYLYEVAEMEGATKWETFWKITFPLLIPSILLCLIYTIIDYFNSTTNVIVRTIDTNMSARLDYAIAQSWVYAIIVLVIVLVVNFFVSRKIVSMD